MKKKQMLALAANLEKSNDWGKSLKANSESQVYEMLIQCQENAISLGNGLEEKGEKGEALMHVLEDYCECIYQLSQNLQNENFCRKMTKKTRQLLNTVRNGVIYDIPDDKTEIVFFPYKASMWDAMESIWKEYASNQDYVTYVVPIPYYDKNPDGSVKKWNYEGNQYPAYVPVTSWEEYDLQEHCPDKIYIHNPYDEFNIVTSVHPAYYSKELKKYTDELIYIPYFVTVGDVQECFVTVPAVMNADKVIVQSQEVKNSYIKVFEQFVGQQQKKIEEQTGKKNVAYWRNLHEMAENKFLALGSPKFQKVRETNRDNVEVPEQWEKLIIKKDGTRKMVILYNTTIDALLKHRNYYISKLVAVLNFMSNQKDCVLLWRPHPLLLSTMDAMIPQLSDTYCKIVEQYKQDGWGIFDDTADLHRAIAISDAYYGDMSSVVALYKETGKRIMIQELQEELPRNL